MSRRNTKHSDNRSRSFGGNRSNRSSNRGGGGGGGRGGGGYKPRGPVEMTKVKCSKCGDDTEVPFKPDGTRPVYCKPCYQQNKPARY
ncbi:MAG: CxxC-x17-CxxC domain-containing protein [Candidatus Heimdallarchaeaceae archaeon]